MIRQQWNPPKIYSLNNDKIVSGANMTRNEQIKFLDTMNCGVSGTLIPTVTSPIVSVCNGPCFTAMLNARPSGTQSNSTNIGICS